MIDLNLNSMTIDANGRVSFSGLSSGIDFRAAVDAIIAAKRIPVDTLETRITENDEKLLTLDEFRSGLTVLRESLSKLYGKMSVGGADNVFRSKQSFTTTSRIDGGIASDSTNLVGITTSNAAAVGTHTIEVLRTAAAHKISSDRINSTTASLGLTDGDSFTIEGQAITVSASDTLLDLRDRINNANTGTTPTGVTASVVSVSASEHYLILTKDDTGTTIGLTDAIGTPLDSIGILNGGGVKNELQAPQTAQFYIDGLLDQTNTIYESSLQAAATSTVATGGTIDFTQDSPVVGLGSITYLAGDDLNDIAANINLNITNVTATVVTDGAGVRLELTGVAGFSMAESGGGDLLNELGVGNKRLLVERSSNTISDVISGVTLSLFQAEQGTTIRIDVNNDINAVKDAITTFVQSYNELRTFINSQRRFDEGSPIQAENSGVLFSSNALRDADMALSRIIGEGAAGLSGDFSVLSQIGVKLISNNEVLDPVLSNTLTIDEAKLDDTILQNFDDLRRLFTFDFAASDPRVSLLGFNENVTYDPDGFTLNVQSSGAYTVPPGPGAVNQIVFSENFEDAYYTTFGGTVTADATADIIGGTAADALTLDNANSLHYVETGALGVTLGQTYTYSVYVKQGSKDQVKLDMVGAGFADANATFDVATGTLLDAGTDLDGVTIAVNPGGYYRISITATATANGSVTVRNQAVDSGAGETFLGDNTDAIYLFGSQFENTSAEAPLGVNNFTTVQATIVNDVDAGPDGGGGGDRIDSQPANQIHEILSADVINVTATNQYTYVAYLKPGTQNTAQLELSDGGGAFAAGTTANFDLTGAGAVTGVGAGADSATIEAAANGYYRVTLTATALLSTATTVADISPNNAVAYAGTGADLFFFEPKVLDTSSTFPANYERTGVTSGTPNQVISANVGGLPDGSDDGSAKAENGLVTVLTGDAKGLSLGTTGFAVDTSIQIDFTIGVGAQMFFALDKILDFQDGIVQSEIDLLNDRNDFNQTRIDEMLVRLEIRRRDLIGRFIRMEAAVSTANRIRESLRQNTEALFGNN